MLKTLSLRKKNLKLPILTIHINKLAGNEVNPYILKTLNIRRKNLKLPIVTIRSHINKLAGNEVNHHTLKTLNIRRKNLKLPMLKTLKLKKTNQNCHMLLIRLPKNYTADHTTLEIKTLYLKLRKQDTF